MSTEKREFPTALIFDEPELGSISNLEKPYKCPLCRRKISKSQYTGDGPEFELGHKRGCVGAHDRSEIVTS